MSILDVFTHKSPSHLQSALRGGATVRRGDTAISVGIRLEDRGRRRLCIGTKLEQPPVIDLTEHSRRFYMSRKVSLSAKSILRMFDGYAIDGIGDLIRLSDDLVRTRLRNEFVIVFTRFEGIHLSSGWGGGVRLATALGCCQALGLRHEFLLPHMPKWEIV